MTGTNDNRAAFQKMLHDSAKHQWEIVLVYKLDRFSRNKYESVVHIKTLKDNGVKLISVMENIPDSPEGVLMESVLEGFNQYYSEELTQKIRRGLRESWLKGNATGGRCILGYRIIEISEKLFALHKKETADNSTLKLLQKNRNEAYKSSRNLIKALEQGIITEQTKERLKELENHINQLDFNIEREKECNYSFLTAEQIRKFLRERLLKNTDNVKMRKLLINTFIREIVTYPDKIVITYYYIEPSEPVKNDKATTEQIVRQSKSAFLLDCCSSIISCSPPRKKRLLFFCKRRFFQLYSPTSDIASRLLRA